MRIRAQKTGVLKRKLVPKWLEVGEWINTGHIKRLMSRRTALFRAQFTFVVSQQVLEVLRAWQEAGERREFHVTQSMHLSLAFLEVQKPMEFRIWVTEGGGEIPYFSQTVVLPKLNHCCFCLSRMNLCAQTWDFRDPFAPISYSTTTPQDLKKKILKYGWFTTLC